MDTDYDTSYTRDRNSEPQNPDFTNPCTEKYKLGQIKKAKCNGKHRHWISESFLIRSMKRIRTLFGNPGNVLRNWYRPITYIFLEPPNISSWTNTDYHLLTPGCFSRLQILNSPYFNSSFLIHPSMLYGASPETTPGNSQFLIPEAIRSTYKWRSIFRGYPLAHNVEAGYLENVWTNRGNSPEAW